jgi:alpha-galactosidase
MKKLFPIIAFVVLSAWPVSADPDQLGDTDKPVKVFILAGQSNMEGYGIIDAGKDEDLVHAAKNDFKYLKDDAGNWVERKDVWYFEKNGERVGNLKVGYGAVSRRFGPKIGPELAFGHVMGQRHEAQVLLIKCAWGGQAIAGPWRPPSAGPNPDPEFPKEFTGNRYREMLEIVKDVTDNLKRYYPDYKGQGFEIAGFFWHQGWNDSTKPAFTAEYESNLIHFVSDVRKDLGVADLPFIVATSGMGGKGGNVVQPQLRAASKVDNCFAVDTTRFRGAKVNRQISHWYNNATSYCKIGRASALAMLVAMQGQTPPKDIVGDVTPK